MRSKTVTNARPVATTKVLVRDITVDVENYTLDVHGFQLVQHESDCVDFDDDVLTEIEYYPECEDIYMRA